MDHSEAVRLQAAVKYVLGELPPAQRDEYEEHCFDCAECALDLKAAAVFVDTTREVMRAERQDSVERNAMPPRSGWFSWFRPVVAVPAFAVLLLVITRAPRSKLWPFAEEVLRLSFANEFLQYMNDHVTPNLITEVSKCPSCTASLFSFTATATPLALSFVIHCGPWSLPKPLPRFPLSVESRWRMWRISIFKISCASSPLTRIFRGGAGATRLS